MRRNNPTKIIVHHSLTPDGSTLSWTAILDYHVNTLGWKDIGYHGGIEQVRGRLVCLYGRPDWMPGAHTKGQNSSSLGFCFVGNYDNASPSEAKLRMAARNVMVDWCLRYGIAPDKIYGHNIFANKSCPGSMFSVGKLQMIVEEELRVAEGRHR